MEIRISLERMRELVQEPHLAYVLKEGRWKYSWYQKAKTTQAKT